MVCINRDMTGTAGLIKRALISRIDTPVSVLLETRRAAIIADPSLNDGLFHNTGPAAATLLFRLVQRYVTNRYPSYFMIQVTRSSMAPALQEDDQIVFREYCYLGGLSRFDPRCPKKGEIVAFWEPEAMIAAVKRVAATPLERIENPDSSGSFLIVPRKHLWLLGDNSACSVDSRKFGFVHLRDVFGIAEDIIRKDQDA